MLEIVNEVIELECNHCGHVLQVKLEEDLAVIKVIPVIEEGITEAAVEAVTASKPVELEYDFTGTFTCPECDNRMSLLI